MSLLDDLIGYWKLDEASGNAVDAHGSNDLTDVATVGTAAGVINGGRDFERGNSEALTLADNADLSLGADQAFTFAGWFQLESKAVSVTALSKDDEGTNREYLLQFTTNDDRWQWIVWDAGGSASFLNADNLGSPSAATWYFIVVWHDPVANVIGIQVNNGTANTTGHAGGTRDLAAAFSIGSRSGLSQFFDGLIDEVGFWKRVLTSDERTELYNEGLALDYSRFDGPTNTGGLYDDLISHWKLDETSGAAIDAHGINNLKDNNAVGTGTGKLNGARDFEESSSQYLSRVDNTHFSTGDIDWTFACWIKPEAIAGNPIVAAKGGAVSTTREWNVYMNGSEGKLHFEVYDSLGGSTEVVSSVVMTAGNWYFMVLRHDSVNNVIDITVNGTKVSTAHTTGLRDGTGPFCLGARDNTLYWDGLIDEASFWKTYLSDADLTTLYNGGAGLSYDDFGGGAVPTVTPDEATHAHAAESPTITQEHVMTPADATHAHAAESPAVTQLHIVGVDEAAHAHAAESPTLTQEHVVSVDEAAHAHAAESPTITQLHIIGVDEPLHTHTAESPTVVSGGAIAPDETAHAHTAESPALTQLHIVGVNEAAHGHAAESPVLTQLHIVGVDETAHAHAAESPSLDSAHVVSPDETLHTHAAELPALTQLHTLSPLDAVHAHTAESPVVVNLSAQYETVNITSYVTSTIEVGSRITTTVSLESRVSR